TPRRTSPDASTPPGSSKTGTCSTVVAMTEPLPIAPFPAPYERRRDARELAQDRLGDSLRRLVDAAVRSSADAEGLDRAREAVEAATALLAAVPARRTPQDTPFHPLSLVGGTAHPVGPQLQLEPDEDGVSGTVRLGPVFEGGPGLSHGGILALMFDHSMGAAVFLAGFAAMTRTLDVVYRAPTPLEAELSVRARVQGVDGRKVRVTGEIRHGATVTATASAVFVTLTPDNVAAI